MTFEYNKICRLCLNHSNTYLMNIFNTEYSIIEKIADLMNIEIFQNDPFPKVICTDCYSNLVIFNEFKSICRNSDSLLKKYQINKSESNEVVTTQSNKGNGKCKSIRNSEEMANRIKECAFKKSMTFIENMKNFYFLINQIEDLESNGGQVIIKNEVSTESLIPSVEINIKNEIIYPNEDNHQGMMGCVIQQPQQESNSQEPKKKKRKNNKRKSINGQATMEIDETGNLLTRQIVTTQDHHQPNIQLAQQNDNEMALMLTVKHSDNQQETTQPHTITVSNQHHTIQPIQIHSNHPLPSLSSTVHHTPQASATTTSSQISIQSTPHTVTTIIPQIQYSCSACNEIFANTDTLRQHLFQSHQVLFPFTTSSTEHQYQVQLPAASITQTSSASLQPVTQQYTFTHPHKKYFESEFPCLLCGVISKNQDDLIKHMIRHTSQAGTSNQPSTTAIIAREREIDTSSTPTDLSNPTQYK
ncbi:CLUMA_CG017455, isoform A [Clunio marinus]|uniref:CLUMA_CG017455, isoform A n=1 Tax=Clunio marinus TaxID=568069 RepID=A0A1J1IXC8_9DIPT|nr:CLUMA_CG017455, isoform A [Clunio marinus]